MTQIIGFVALNAVGLLTLMACVSLVSLVIDFLSKRNMYTRNESVIVVLSDLIVLILSLVFFCVLPICFFETYWIGELLIEDKQFLSAKDSLCISIGFTAAMFAACKFKLAKTDMSI
ncbi:hypothetical protein I3271_07605 [Photobacterium leiognathi]|uniref:hypothetical protein n=1 Tax=Photobacterium leiognathi TaxID=553611 RepID=UPI001EDE4CA3|nr:hypothetical protein [Photobacterium leiognathi]MCG3884552.1 hypothetical protein [Photobacterium leiognathi]